MPSRRSITRCKAKGCRPAGRPCSAASPAAISGRAARRTAPRLRCNFCDTDFVGTDGPGGGRFADADALAQACRAAWRGNGGTRPFIVLTGGEPMLQVDEALIGALHALCFEIAIETNGTLPVPRAIDWICVSPKAGAPLVQRSGDELKLVYPQSALRPAGGRGASLPALPAAAHGRWAGEPGQPRSRYCLLPRAPQMAVEPADPQAARLALARTLVWRRKIP